MCWPNEMAMLYLGHRNMLMKWPPLFFFKTQLYIQQKDQFCMFSQFHMLYQILSLIFILELGRNENRLEFCALADKIFGTNNNLKKIRVTALAHPCHD